VKKNRASFGAVVSNWREYDAGTMTKLRLAAKNYWLRVRHLDTCCGNDGEPGC
jgi:hypothetical protein